MCAFVRIFALLSKRYFEKAFFLILLERQDHLKELKEEKIHTWHGIQFFVLADRIQRLNGYNQEIRIT